MISLAITDKHQDYFLPMIVQVVGHEFRPNPESVRSHLQGPLDTLLTQHLHDAVNRDPDQPMPFRLDSVQALWDLATELPPEEPGGGFAFARLSKSQKELLYTALHSYLIRIQILAAREGIPAPADMMRDLNHLIREFAR